MPSSAQELPTSAGTTYGTPGPSWLIQNGTPLYDLQEMSGWKSAAMVRRYATLVPAHIARHAAVVDGLLRVTSTAQ